MSAAALQKAKHNSVPDMAMRTQITLATCDEPTQEMQASRVGQSGSNPEKAKRMPAPHPAAHEEGVAVNLLGCRA